jgi:hypothetical protein
VSLIPGRVRTLILSTTPSESCSPDRLDAIRRGVSDALAARPCRAGDLTAVPKD